MDLILASQIIEVSQEEVIEILSSVNVPPSGDIQVDKLTVAQIYYDASMMSLEELEKLKSSFQVPSQPIPKVTAQTIIGVTISEMHQVLTDNKIPLNKDENMNRIKLGKLYFDNNMMTPEELDKLYNANTKESLSNIIYKATNLITDITDIISGYLDFSKSVFMNFDKYANRINFDEDFYTNDDVMYALLRYPNSLATTLKMWDIHSGEELKDLDLDGTNEVKQALLVPRKENNIYAPNFLGHDLDIKYNLITVEIFNIRFDKVKVYQDFEVFTEFYISKYSSKVTNFAKDRCVVQEFGNILKIVDINSGEVLMMKKLGRDSYISSIIILSDDKIVILGTRDINIWDLKSDTISNVRLPMIDGSARNVAKYSDTELVYPVKNSIVVVYDYVKDEIVNMITSQEFDHATVLTGGLIAVNSGNTITLYRKFEGKFEEYTSFACDNDDYYPEHVNLNSVSTKFAIESLSGIFTNKLLVNFISPSRKVIYF